MSLFLSMTLNLNSEMIRSTLKFLKWMDLEMSDPR